MIDTEWTGRARTGAGLIAFVTGVTLLTRLYLQLQQSDGLIAALSQLAQFFTILTNSLVCIIMALIAFGWRISPRIVLAIVIAIACVGIIYHLLLAHLADLRGINLLADHGVHTIVPALSVIWWLFLSAKQRFQKTDIVVWLVWPTVYVIYILIRANFSGFYPYPFMSVPEIGWGRLAVNLAGLSFGFVVVGLLLVGLARLLGGIRKHEGFASQRTRP